MLQGFLSMSDILVDTRHQRAKKWKWLVDHDQILHLIWSMSDVKSDVIVYKFM